MYVCRSMYEEVWRGTNRRNTLESSRTPPGGEITRKDRTTTSATTLIGIARYTNAKLKSEWRHINHPTSTDTSDSWSFSPAYWDDVCSLFSEVWIARFSPRVDSTATLHVGKKRPFSMRKRVNLARESYESLFPPDICTWELGRISISAVMCASPTNHDGGKGRWRWCVKSGRDDDVWSCVMRDAVDGGTGWCETCAVRAMHLPFSTETILGVVNTRVNTLVISILERNSGENFLLPVSVDY